MSDRFTLVATRGPWTGRYFDGFDYEGRGTAVPIWADDPDRACLLSVDQVEYFIERLGPEFGPRPETADPPQPLPARVRHQLERRVVLSKTQANAAAVVLPNV